MKKIVVPLIMDENSPPTACSKPGCKRFSSGKFKRCDPCRTRQAALVRKSRLKEKTAQVVNATDLSKGRKRARNETSAELERPTRRARAASIISDDEDDEDDGMPFVALDTKVSCGFTGLGNILTFTFQAAEDYMDAEDLFHALRDQFKASSHVDFYGTYPIEEDDLITPKERTHMLAEELWKTTGYRFT